MKIENNIVVYNEFEILRKLKYCSLAGFCRYSEQSYRQ